MTVLTALSVTALTLIAPPEIKWESTFKSAIDAATTGNKVVMIDFYTDWCGWCKKLDADTYTDKSVVAISGKFVNVKIDAEKNDGPELAKKYGVSGFPTLVFVDGKGDVVSKIVGYQGPKDFANSLTKIEKQYREFPQIKAKYEANPADPTAASMIADIYASRGDIAGAEKAVNGAAQANPNDPKLAAAYNVIGDYYQNAGKFDTAREWFTKATKNSKGHDLAYARISIAACYYGEGKLAEGKPFLQQILKQKDAPKDLVDTAKQMLGDK